MDQFDVYDDSAYAGFALGMDDSLNFGDDLISDFTFRASEQTDTLPPAVIEVQPREPGEKKTHTRSEDDEEEADSAPATQKKKSTRKASDPNRVPKKPGRKPILEEPVSKRKAQNRAAQRAFRERKEKHVKDLEDRVAELEETSESKDTENAALKSEISRLTAELERYKQSLQGGFGMAGVPMRRPQDVRFDFEFPRFGALNGAQALPSMFGLGNTAISSMDTTFIPTTVPSSDSSPPVLDGFVSNDSITTTTTNRGSVSGPELYSTASVGSVPALSASGSPGDNSSEPTPGSSHHYSPDNSTPSLDDDAANFNNEWLNTAMPADLTTSTLFDDSFLITDNFDDQTMDDFSQNFRSTYNMPAASPAKAPHKKAGLLAEIDQQLINIQDECPGLADTINGMPRLATGEFDLDSFCDEMRHKLTCNGEETLSPDRVREVMKEAAVCKASKAYML